MGSVQSASLAGGHGTFQCEYIKTNGKLYPKCEVYYQKMVNKINELGKYGHNEKCSSKKATVKEMGMNLLKIEGALHKHGEGKGNHDEDRNVKAYYDMTKENVRVIS